jgi:hypothetical protein
VAVDCQELNARCGESWVIRVCDVSRAGQFIEKIWCDRHRNFPNSGSACSRSPVMCEIADSSEMRLHLKILTPTISRRYLGTNSPKSSTAPITKPKHNSIKPIFALYYNITQKNHDIPESPRRETPAASQKWSGARAWIQYETVPNVFQLCFTCNW